MSMSERIRERRKEMNLTQEELAVRLGLQKSAVAKYENGRVENIKRAVLEQMAQVLNCTPAYLMDWSEEGILPPREEAAPAFRIPILSVPPDTKPPYREELVTGSLSTEKDPGALFAMRLSDDSMAPGLKRDTVIIVDPQQKGREHDLVLASVASRVCCRCLRRYRNSIALVAQNPNYEPMYFSDYETELLPVRIIGTVIEARSYYS